MDSKKHDTVFSMTSHLPHLIAYNLVKTATDFEKRQRYELIKFSAGGLRDFSRIAASNEIMWRDIFFNNQKNISKVIDLFIKNLRSFKRDIQFKNNKSIIKKLVNTKKVRKKIIKLKQDINKPDFGRSPCLKRDVIYVIKLTLFIIRSRAWIIRVLMSRNI